MPDDEENPIFAPYEAERQAIIRNLGYDPVTGCPASHEGEVHTVQPASEPKAALAELFTIQDREFLCRLGIG